MKKIISIFVVIAVLMILLFTLTGCTLKIETTDNSVEASVDGDTTEKVDGVLDWIKERISRVFNSSSSEDKTNSEGTTTTEDVDAPTTKVTAEKI